MTILPSRSAVASPKLLAEDARNRTLRTLIQQLAFDIAFAVAIVVYDAVQDTERWNDFEWSLLLLTVTKTVFAVGASFVMRYYLDGSPVPTPLPPKPQAEPAETAPIDTLVTNGDESSPLG